MLMIVDCTGKLDQVADHCRPMGRAIGFSELSMPAKAGI